MAKQGTQEDPMLTEDDESLFELLRALRKVISEEEKVPPYVIFHDSTLREMCSLLPLDRESMLAVKGVGERKFERYGERFLGVITEYNAQ